MSSVGSRGSDGRDAKRHSMSVPRERGPLVQVGNENGMRIDGEEPQEPEPEPRPGASLGSKKAVMAEAVDVIDLTEDVEHAQSDGAIETEPEVDPEPVPQTPTPRQSPPPMQAEREPSTTPELSYPTPDAMQMDVDMGMALGVTIDGNVPPFVMPIQEPIFIPGGTVEDESGPRIEEVVEDEVHAEVEVQTVKGVVEEEEEEEEEEDTAGVAATVGPAETIAMDIDTFDEPFVHKPDLLASTSSKKLHSNLASSDPSSTVQDDTVKVWTTLGGPPVERPAPPAPSPVPTASGSGSTSRSTQQVRVQVQGEAEAGPSVAFDDLQPDAVPVPRSISIPTSTSASSKGKGKGKVRSRKQAYVLIPSPPEYVKRAREKERALKASLDRRRAAGKGRRIIRVESSDEEMEQDGQGMDSVREDEERGEYEQKAIGMSV